MTESLPRRREPQLLTWWKAMKYELLWMGLRPITVHLSFYLLSVWFSGPGEFHLNVFLQLDEAVSVSFLLNYCYFWVLFIHTRSIIKVFTFPMITSAICLSVTLMSLSVNNGLIIYSIICSLFTGIQQDDVLIFCLCELSNFTSKMRTLWEICILFMKDIYQKLLLAWKWILNFRK